MQNVILVNKHSSKARKKVVRRVDSDAKKHNQLSQMLGTVVMT